MCAVKDKMLVIKEEYAKFLQLGSKSARIAAGYPASETEFAEKHDVSRMTLHNWKNDPDFKKMVTEPALTFFSVEDLNKILHAMKLRAFEGNTSAAKLVLELSGVIGQFKVDSTPDDGISCEVSKMSDRELEALLDGDD